MSNHRDGVDGGSPSCLYVERHWPAAPHQRSLAMTVLKRRLCYGVACTVLVAAGIVALLPADRALNGLPRKDIVEIQRLIRIETWQFAATMLSSSSIVHAP